jgi:hypothetical protein
MWRVSKSRLCWGWCMVRYGIRIQVCQVSQWNVSIKFICWMNHWTNCHFLQFTYASYLRCLAYILNIFISFKLWFYPKVCWHPCCYSYLFYLEPRYNSFGIATDFGLDDRVSIPGRGKIFLFSTTSTQALGPNQPLIQWILGIGFPGVKRQGCAADH